jgi:hypothetical protein
LEQQLKVLYAKQHSEPNVPTMHGTPIDRDNLTFQQYQQQMRAAACESSLPFPNTAKPPPGYGMNGKGVPLVHSPRQPGTLPHGMTGGFGDTCYRQTHNVPGTQLLSAPNETYRPENTQPVTTLNYKKDGIAPSTIPWGPLCTRTDLGPVAKANWTFSPPKWLIEDDEEDQYSIWYDDKSDKYLLKTAEDAQAYRGYHSYHDAMYGPERSNLAKKLGSFKGTTVEEFREYLHDFRQVARLECWVNLQKLNRLRCNLSLQLTSAVRSQEKRMGKPFVTFRDLKFCVYEELRSSHNLVWAQQNFRRRVRKQGESPRQFMRALLDLAELVYPKDHETRACEQFTQLVTDDDNTFQRMESYTSLQGRVDPEALVEIAEDGERSSRSSVLADLKRAGYTPEDIASGKIDWQRPLPAQSVNIVTGQAKADIQASTTTNLVEGTDGSTRDVECYSCGYRGHFRYRCPRPNEPRYMRTDSNKNGNQSAKSRDSRSQTSWTQTYVERRGNSPSPSRKVTYPIRPFSPSRDQRVNGRFFSPSRHRRSLSPQRRSESPQRQSRPGKSNPKEYRNRVRLGSRQIRDKLLDMAECLGYLELDQPPDSESVLAGNNFVDNPGTESQTI